MRRHQSSSAVPPPPCARQRGQAMIEYLVVTSTVALVLFIPTTLTNDMSLADYLARAVRAFFRSYSFMMSVA